MKVRIKNIKSEIPYQTFSFFLSGAMMPYFPENVENVTVQIGLSAELRCKVENLNNYKVVKSVLISEGI